MDPKTIKKSTEYVSMTSKPNQLFKNGCKAAAMVFDGSKLPITSDNQVMPEITSYCISLNDMVNLIFSDIEKANANPKVPKSAFPKLNEVPFVFVFRPTGSEFTSTDENGKEVKETYTVQHHIVVCYLPNALGDVTTPVQMLHKCYVQQNFTIMSANDKLCVAINKDPYGDYFKDADVIQYNAQSWLKSLNMFPEDEEDEPLPSMDDFL